MVSSLSNLLNSFSINYCFNWAYHLELSKKLTYLQDLRSSNFIYLWVVATLFAWLRFLRFFRAWIEISMRLLLCALGTFRLLIQRNLTSLHVRVLASKASLFCALTSCLSWMTSLFFILISKAGCRMRFPFSEVLPRSILKESDLVSRLFISERLLRWIY